MHEFRVYALSRNTWGWITVKAERCGVDRGVLYFKNGTGMLNPPIRMFARRCWREVVRV